MSGTKDKILHKALELFNQQGYAAVNFLELSRHLQMSRGNLTYHFRDKDSLLKALADQMWSMLADERQRTRGFPSFENLHHNARTLYKVQKSFSFIFLDHNVLNHPLLDEQFRKMRTEMIEDNRLAIAFAIQLGNMSRETIPGSYENLAYVTWMISFYWLSQETFPMIGTEESCERVLWKLLLPHFTTKGIASFIKYFGRDYYDAMGQPFNLEIDEFMTL